MRKPVVSIGLVVLSALIILVAVFAPFKKDHGYQLPAGWKNPSMSADLTVCERPIMVYGYPFAEKRPYQDGCSDSYNRLAFVLNNVICATGWIMLGSGLIMSFISLTGKSHDKE